MRCGIRSALLTVRWIRRFIKWECFLYIIRPGAYVWAPGLFFWPPLGVRFFQVLLGGGEHQLDAVQLIDLAGAGIVVDGYDVGAGESLAQLFDHALAHHMVRQAAEGLGADDIVYVAVD